MGFFKSVTKVIKNSLGMNGFKNMLDPLNLVLKDKKQEAPAPAPAPAAMDSSTLTDDQLSAEAQKRMAKLGRYFTSPLGVLQQASTGSQKVFS